MISKHFHLELLRFILDVHFARKYLSSDINQNLIKASDIYFRIKHLDPQKVIRQNSSRLKFVCFLRLLKM